MVEYSWEDLLARLRAALPGLRSLVWNENRTPGNTVLAGEFATLWGEDAVLFTVFSFTVKMYLLNKVLSTFVVMVWNYFTKRYILTKNA